MFEKKILHFPASNYIFRNDTTRFKKTFTKKIRIDVIAYARQNSEKFNIASILKLKSKVSKVLTMLKYLNDITIKTY